MVKVVYPADWNEYNNMKANRRHLPFRPFVARKVAFFTGAVYFTWIFFTRLFSSSSSRDVATSSTIGQKNNDDNNRSSSSYTVHREVIDGTIDVLWAKPLPLEYDGDDITGILFVAHGCSHSNTDWYTKEEGCSDCIGLPEERAIVKIATDLGLIVLALSSMNRQSKCWNLRKDVKPLARALKYFTNRFSESKSQQSHQHHIPIYAFGASSGGGFVSSITSKLKTDYQIGLSGFISQIAAKPSYDDESSPLLLSCRVYITMDRDEHTDASANSIVEECNNSKNNKNENQRCKHIRLPPRPIQPNFFSERIPEITVSESNEMVRVFQEAGIVNKDTYEVINDPRRSDWRDALSLSLTKSRLLKFPERGDRLEADKSPISETMNVAWGMHELARDGVQDALEFCIANNVVVK